MVHPGAGVNAGNLGPVALADAQRVLDRAAARLYVRGSTVIRSVTAAGGDDGPVDDGTDQVAPLGEGEEIPVVRRQRHRGQHGRPVARRAGRVRRPSRP